jgi:hypothetical protein
MIPKSIQVKKPNGTGRQDAAVHPAPRAQGRGELRDTGWRVGAAFGDWLRWMEAEDAQLSGPCLSA